MLLPIIAILFIISIDCNELHTDHIPKILPSDVTILSIRSSKPLKLDVNTFKDISYEYLVILDLSNNSISSLPDNIFTPMVHLTHLSLANNSLCYSEFTNLTFHGLSKILIELNLHSMSCHKGQTIYAGQALQTLTALKRLTITGINATNFCDEFSQLKNLESLSLVGRYCDIGDINNNTFAAFNGSSKLSELTIRGCGMDTITHNSLMPFRNRLKTVNFACNPGVKWEAAMGALLDAYLLDCIDTLIVDDINPENRSNSFHPSVFEQSVRGSSLRRLSIRANNIIIFGVENLDLLHVLKYINVGFNQLKFDASDVFFRDLVKESRKLPLDTIDASYLFEGRNLYRQQYCQPDGPYDADSYFRSEKLKSVDYKRTTSNSTEDTTKSTIKLSPIPSSVQTLYLDGYHNKKNHLTTLGDLRLEPVNQLVVLNFSSSFIRIIKGPFINFNKLQVLSVANSQVNDIRKYAFKDLTRLLYLYLDHNKLSDIPCTAFDGLQNLLHLQLSDNKLRTLSADIFEHLVSLKTLDLSYNNLYEIDFYMTSPTLALLSMSHNPLKSVLPALTRHSAGEYNKSTTFDFTGLNSFVCDCKTIRFSYWWDQDLVTRKGNLMCSNKAISVRQFGHNGMKCGQAPSKYRAIIVILSLLFVSIALATVVLFIRYMRGINNRSSNTSNIAASRSIVTSSAAYRQFVDEDIDGDISFRT